MPSPPTTERRWSLTRRLTWRFAATTGALLIISSLGSGYFVFDTLRAEAKLFMLHETEELSHNIQAHHDSPARIRETVLTLAAAIEHPACAFRVRDADGRLLAEGGKADLLAKVDQPIPFDTVWRKWLHTRELVVMARPITGSPGLAVEILVDGKPYLERIRSYARSSLLALALGLVLAAFAGWFTAHHGLRHLREMVRQAEAADPVAGGTQIALVNAPEEIRAVAEALDHLLRRIDAGLSRMRTFTAGLAHELRSPLQNLIGETEVTLLHGREPAEYARVLRSNLEDLSDLSDAIDNLVAYCRSAEPPSRRPERELFDLADEARLRLESEGRSAARRHVALEVESSGDTRLAADRESCLRVLRNLVGNAVDWSPEGSTVHVVIEGRDDEVSLCVEDTGPGVPEHLADKLFEPFVTSRAPGGQRGGYGLGLAICRTVMDQHGGRLRHEPRPGGGSRFVADFPRAA